MIINKVRISGPGYIVNDNMGVPMVADNIQYKEVLEYINNGGYVEPEYSLDGYKENKISILKTKRIQLEDSTLANLQVEYNGITYAADDTAVMQLSKIVTSINFAIAIINDEASDQGKRDSYQMILDQLLPIASNTKRYWTDINRNPNLVTFEDVEHIKLRVDRIHNELVPTIGDLIFNKYAIIRSQILLCSTKTEVDSIDIDQIYNYDTNNILEGLIEQFKLIQ